jgi:DnaK suppressor protein
MNKADRKKFRAKLTELQEQLETLRSTGDEAAQTVELDQARVGRLSRMDAMRAQSMSVEAARRRDLQLQRVKAALQRIDSDDFGICRDCDEDINPQRLEFDPSTTYCITCAQALES